MARVLASYEELLGLAARRGHGRVEDAVVAPLIVIFAVTPLIVVLSLLFVAVFMTPALAALVGDAALPAARAQARRLDGVQHRRGRSAPRCWPCWPSWSSLPLWLVPPLILVLPPLIWGWLTYRVMAFDALVRTCQRRGAARDLPAPPHVAAGHRRGDGLPRARRPACVWASGALFAAAFVILVPVAIWIYTLVFAFASLWFSHYCLAALQRLRAEASPAPPDPGAAPPAPLALADDATFPSA